MKRSETELHQIGDSFPLVEARDPIPIRIHAQPRVVHHAQYEYTGHPHVNLIRDKYETHPAHRTSHQASIHSQHVTKRARKIPTQIRVPEGLNVQVKTQKLHSDSQNIHVKSPETGVNDLDFHGYRVHQIRDHHDTHVEGEDTNTALDNKNYVPTILRDGHTRGSYSQPLEYPLLSPIHNIPISHGHSIFPYRAVNYDTAISPIPNPFAGNIQRHATSTSHIIPHIPQGTRIVGHILAHDIDRDPDSSHAVSPKFVKYVNRVALQGVNSDFYTNDYSSKGHRLEQAPVVAVPKLNLRLPVSFVPSEGIAYNTIIPIHK